ncbi:hypothetical protein DPSP01_013545 [Paraphaeosphaeria sporulosa]|uniref:Zn(2)-C6 fungal-type domain-containing protein n=1 Tax=Paraphaeosphaeria sporulosa TaxID=1460663 RepID=A0A177C0D6_9PLEO|nr:uncharacterized protein CC84DRAFT_1101434 [Paraphaeosphaeria sporulosa]OAG01254.1 hypothetical protein CC84DRAFT_1101434 [Paraphaeosphaeria sporulosa]
MSTPIDEAETPEQQRAAKRKTHRKSRNGCFQCKQRHTKCNEEHPRCGNCVRLDIHCTWPSRERFSTKYPTPPESHAVATAERTLSVGPDVPVSSFGSPMSIADLRLLHHWSTKSYQDMNADPARWPAWQIDCVEVAFDFPFLLRGILALAAIHKTSCDPQADRQSLLLQADTHISSALETYRKNLEHPSEETAMAMFLLSMVIVTYNLASAQLEAPEDPIGALHHCFRLVQGVALVIQPHVTQIMNSKMMSKIVEQGPGITFEGKVPEVLRLKKLAETKRTSAHDFYTLAIDDLHTHFLKTRQCPPENDRLAIAFSWSSHLSEEFLHLISTHDPITALVLAHFAVLLTECRLAWWIAEWPLRIVLAAQKLLVATPELLAYLDWPLEIVKASAGER